MRALLPGEVSLYLLDLPSLLPYRVQFLETLSPDEHLRMQRFYTPVLQDHFLLTRGVLREILGRHLGREASRLCFEYSDLGKPCIQDTALHFNLAHSGEACLLALTLNDNIGVDIEKISRKINVLQIAKRFFTAREYAALQASPVAPQLFYHIWTQKEAFLKAIGEGLSFGLDRFEVSVVFECAQVFDIQAPQYAKVCWDTMAFALSHDYYFAVTKENKISQLYWETFSDEAP